ncbi:Uu.00g000970.m01.CDS01 [Anthostomella pinea]|uniref:Glutamate--tRNA ligase, mitochondrial n=1 Tax=Anthostomella pinea TaxID=933095 RepID=A0AAI8VJD3_9PEZI|nr:Uu.00g000970.m01.CDS01 [Anthostomella pinea]
MRSLYILHGPLRRGVLARPCHIIRRSKFSGRPALVDTPKTTLLPTTAARTRFAPSPTGYLHIGSLRTALYNYLLAKATGGQFLLRIEDTDRTRIVSDAESRLYEDLKWTGLSWDEGPDVGGQYGPYRQSERLELYTKHANQLMDEGRAYRCFCTPEDLDEMKALNMQDGSAPLYNGTCSHIPPDQSRRRAESGEPHCVRFKCEDHAPFVNDLVYGVYKKPGKEDDFIIIKRDGYPTYHFANVVDDHLMEITHVVRGAEWLVSTPRHVAMYEGFGWKSPEFAHVGLLVDKKKQKLSKRHGDIDIASWRDQGILPAALLNYVMLLGWSHGRGEKGHSEVMDLDEMINKFHLKFTKGDITVNAKDEFLQKAHIRRYMKTAGRSDALEQLIPGLESWVRKFEDNRTANANSNGDGGLVLTELGTAIGPLVPLARPSHDNPAGADTVASRSYLKDLLDFDIKGYATPRDYLMRNVHLLWQIPEKVYEASLSADLDQQRGFFVREDPDAPLGSTSDPPRTVHELTATLRELVRGIAEADWTKQSIDDAISPFVRSVYSNPTTMPGVQVWGYHLLRWVIAAMRPGPAIIPSMALLGRDETLRRMDMACEVAERIHGKPMLACH